MTGLIQRLTGSDAETEEDTDQFTAQETAQMVLEDILGEFQLTDGRVGGLINAEDAKKIQKLGVYDEGRMDSRMIGFISRHPDHFTAYIIVRDINEDQFDTELEVELRSIDFTGEELKNDIVGDFVRTFSYRGPDVKFDIEGEDIQLTVYSY